MPNDLKWNNDDVILFSKDLDTAMKLFCENLSWSPYVICITLQCQICATPSVKNYKSV